jgi:phosphoglycolate phosphatase-like HAD superfamily hydrolase
MDSKLKFRLFSHSAKIVFWDFDGVIKDSISVKTKAFVDLFESYGTDVVRRVRDHHEQNGGMSRFEKIPTYLGFAGVDPSVSRVRDLSEQFGHLVRQGVISSPWVPGVEKHIQSKNNSEIFVIVSATPQKELEDILKSLQLKQFFNSVYGSPIQKVEAVRSVLQVSGIEPKDCLMIGDALVDLEASRSNDVPFLLRRHDTNALAFAKYGGEYINTFEGF